MLLKKLVTHVIASVVFDCSDGFGLEFLFDNNLDLFGRGTTLVGGGFAFDTARLDTPVTCGQPSLAWFHRCSRQSILHDSEK